RSEELFLRARTKLPGGVNSPVRAFNSVGGTPIFFERAEGSAILDADGRRFVDFCMSWGPLILGHGHERVVSAVHAAVERGLSYGACHAGEGDLAERILRGFPWAEQVRMVSSGTEAVMTALRLARGVTGRSHVLKFEGGYHGHSDGLLVKAGSGLATQAIATSAGIPPEIASTTLVCPLGDLASVEQVFDQMGDRLAAVVIEPLPANNGLLVQDPRFLQGLRELCSRAGAMLVFDEVISGFRLQYGGYGAMVGVKPDLVTLGKVIGGGMPIGAIVGPRETMENLAPTGPVYQAGTLSGNPVSVAAGCATLDVLEQTAPYEALDSLGARLEEGLTGLRGLQVVRQGSIVWLYLSEGRPDRADAIDGAIVDRFARLHGGLLEQGYYLPPSAFEVLFLSSAHTDSDVDGLVGAVHGTWD
ncbi:MAG: glutamate-1-semialdehyde 2,1-aminomutase, partial [Myxococcota bacterium]|nr:glutamate-1-semialdehyde 2,1-aminomutase [Myxococcota bacterium]